MTPFIRNRQIEMGFGMIRAEQDSSLERAYRLRPFVFTEVGEPQVQKQIPFVETEPRCCEIFADLVCRPPGHPVRKAQVIMRECIVIVRVQKVAMQFYRCRVILKTEREISIDVAYLVVGCASPTASHA